MAGSEGSKTGRIEQVDPGSASKMRDALESMSAGVLVVDAEGRIEYANRAAAATSGLEPADVVGQLAADPAWQLTDHTGEVLSYDALPVPTALRERRAVRDVELGVPTLTGEMRWIRVSAQPLFEPDGDLRGAVVTTEDVTVRHQLAEQLLQAQKLESIGQLAGGIAHDFNNLLTAIICNVDIALSVGPRADVVKSLEEIGHAAERGASLTRQMLTFARKQVAQARSVDLGVLIDSVAPLVQRMLGDGVVVTHSAGADLWLVLVDPSQLEQVLINLAVNARDAMAHQGSLAVEACNVALDAETARETHAKARPGDYVRLSVADDGAGIPEEVLPRIFDPFFTTKSSSDGTGLGLSICHNVVKHAGGFISVASEVGRGTTFDVWLPRHDGNAWDDAGAKAALAPVDDGTRILLVEDQELVRSLLIRVLQGYGYRVLAASDGEDALVLLERTKEPIALLLTDVSMPNMSGAELARKLRRDNPDLPVLFMTGFVDTTGEVLAQIADEELLLKPFTPMQLLERVQRSLSTRES